jgi:hypothetical protein
LTGSKLNPGGRAGRAYLVPPDADQLEVSIFGPGLGEAIVIHLGDGDWVLVDSGVHPETGEPVALTYLRDIGVDVAQAVTLVLATHWHDDHVAGVAQTFEACESAAFACSDALRPMEFLALVEAADERSLMARSGVGEFAQVISILKRRRVKNQRFPAPHFAVAGRPVMHDGKWSITALSPSDASKVLALRGIHEAAPVPGSTKRKVLPPTPNHASVALVIAVNHERILLGADLENTHDPGTGWSAVLAGGYLDERSSLFKIPHHGSDDADCPEIWRDWLFTDAVAILTPFLQGDQLLPKLTDVECLCARPQRICTTSTAPIRRRRRASAVEKTIDRTVRWLKNAEPPIGQARARKSACALPGDPWAVELFPPAGDLCPMQ